MIVVRLKSGMGNQMFQYAFGIRIAKILNTDVQFDLSALLDRSRGPDFVYRNFDLDIFDADVKTTHPRKLLEVLAQLKSNSITKFFRERVKKNRTYIQEADFAYQNSIIENPLDNAVYEGWFQSYKYLEEIESQLRIGFQFKEPIIPYSKELEQKIKNSNAVCLNVRRTDFVKNDNLNVAGLAYFNKSVELIADKVSKPVFFIFSDDIDWCRKNFRLKQETVIVDHSHKGFKFGNYMQLMSACKHFIIPNSSFAWWSAWLSPFEDKVVIAPKNWFSDPMINTSTVTPPEWMRI